MSFFLFSADQGGKPIGIANSGGGATSADVVGTDGGGATAADVVGTDGGGATAADIVTVAVRTELKYCEMYFT